MIQRVINKPPRSEVQVVMVGDNNKVIGEIIIIQIIEDLIEGK